MSSLGKTAPLECPSVYEPMEHDVRSLFSKVFKGNMVEFANKFSILDGIDVKNKIVIEIKNRSCELNKHYDTMMPINKYLKWKKDYPTYRLYYIFKFPDKPHPYWYEVKENKMNQVDTRSGGRTDRGKPEIKQYHYIPVRYLIPLVEPDQVKKETPEWKLSHQEQVDFKIAEIERIQAEVKVMKQHPDYHIK